MIKIKFDNNNFILYKEKKPEYTDKNRYEFEELDLVTPHLLLRRTFKMTLIFFIGQLIYSYYTEMSVKDISPLFLFIGVIVVFIIMMNFSMISLEMGDGHYYVIDKKTGKKKIISTSKYKKIKKKIRELM